MGKSLVTAFKLNIVTLCPFRAVHATAFSHSYCSSTIMSVWFLMLCFCLLIVPLFQTPRSSPMTPRHPSVTDVWVLLRQRVQPSTDVTFRSHPQLQPPSVLSSLSPTPVKRGNMGGVLQCKHNISRLEPQCLMLAFAAVQPCPTSRLYTHAGLRGPSFASVCLGFSTGVLDATDMRLIFPWF